MRYFRLRLEALDLKVVPLHDDSRTYVNVEPSSCIPIVVASFLCEIKNLGLADLKVVALRKKDQ